MPSRDRFCPIQTAWVNRREVLQVAVLTGTGLAGTQLFSRSDETKEQETLT